MDAALRAEVEILRGLESAEAADYVLRTYPLEALQWGRALDLIASRSWKREDQVRLAEHYLSRIPYASALPYEVFAGLLPFADFVRIIQHYWPKAQCDHGLLCYHLAPLVKRYVEAGADRKQADELLRTGD
jgi:hypothetical protein